MQFVTVTVPPAAPMARSLLKCTSAFSSPSANAVMSACTYKEPETGTVTRAWLANGPFCHQLAVPVLDVRTCSTSSSAIYPEYDLARTFPSFHPTPS